MSTSTLRSKGRVRAPDVLPVKRVACLWACQGERALSRKFHRIGTVVVLGVTLLLCARAQSQTPAFTAVCDESTGRSYVGGTTESVAGHYSERWSESGTISPRGWRFRYDGRDSLYVDTEVVPVVSREGNVLMGVRTIGRNSRIYMIHFGIPKIVMTAYSAWVGDVAPGFLVMTIGFDCEFSFE